MSPIRERTSTRALRLLRAGAMAVALLFATAPIAWAAGLQGGAPFKAPGNTGGKLSWSFSGEFLAEPGEI